MPEFDEKTESLESEGVDRLAWRSRETYLQQRVAKTGHLEDLEMPPNLSHIILRTDRPKMHDGRVQAVIRTRL